MRLELKKFPAGEVHCEVNNIQDEDLLYIQYEGDNLNDYIMRVMMAADVIKRRQKSCRLFLPYLPYSRQDRPTSLNEPFSLKVFGNMINSCGFKEVITLDVHSDVAYACIDNLVNIPIIDYIDKWFLAKETLNEKTLVIPDQGAFKKLSYLATRMQGPVISIKKRELSTGYLTIERISGKVEGRDCLIVDDICDGGMTFILLANELYKKGAKSVELLVTHGLFSKGIQVLRDAGIGTIYTTNSFLKYGTTFTDVNFISCLDVCIGYQLAKGGSVYYEY